MTEKVNPSPSRPAEAFKTAGSIALAGGSEEGYVVSGTSPTTISTQDTGIDETAFTAFSIQTSGSSFDVTIEPGEAFVFGSWLAIDVNTTVTIASSTTETVYVGWDKTASNDVIIGPDDGRFANAGGDTDQKIALWDVTTDGSGVTSVSDRRVIGRRVTGQHIQPNSTQSGAYTTSGEQIIFVDTSGGAVTITLSNVDTDSGNEIVVTDISGNAVTNNITVDTEGSQTIDGETSTTIETDYGTVRVASDGSNWYSSGGGGATLSVSQDGSVVLPGPTDLDFLDMTVTDDGDGTVSTEYDPVSETRVWRGEDGVMSGLTLESSDTMTIPSDNSMVVGEQYTVDGTLTVDGNLTVVDNEDEKPPRIDSTTATLSGGSSPALDTTYTTSITDASIGFDAIVSPQSSSYGFSYEYNYDVSVGYDGTNVTVGITVNWDDDPGAGNDVGVDIDLYNRQR